MRPTFVMFIFFSSPNDNNCQFPLIFFPCIFRKVTENDEWQMVMSSYLSIVSRILLMDSMVFIQVLQELNMPSPLETILDIWIQKMPLIGQADKRKLLSK